MMNTAQRVKKAIRELAGRAGLHVLAGEGFPFGVDWLSDVMHFPEGRAVRFALDVGANRGQTALDLAEAFPGATVHSFEPVAATFEALQRAVSGLEHVHAHRLALAETPGELVMTAGNDSINRLVSAEAGGESLGAVERVPVTTIDRFCEEHGVDTIDLLKVDVEGAELRVLKGARESFERRGIPLILSECDFLHRPYEPHAGFGELFEFLGPLGYRVVAFYSAGVDEQGWRWGNVLFRRMAHEAPGDVSLCPLVLRGVSTKGQGDKGAP